MPLDPKYVIAPSLQEYFVDKSNGFPLAGGKVFFYSDVNRTTPKPVYEISGNPPNYQYTALPNPVILSNVGTIQDINGNDVLPYYYPYDDNGDVELYYIVVQDSLGAPQFTREGWPNIASTTSVEDNIKNFIPNGQFLIHNNLPNNEIVDGSNIIAQGGWSFEVNDPVTSTNTLQFIRLPYTQNPPESPRYDLQISCSAPDPLETIKNLRIKFKDVNKFSGDESTYTFSFSSYCNIPLSVTMQIVKYFGIGGSVVTPIVINTIELSTTRKIYQFQFEFGLNTGYILGAGNDDFVAIDLALPRNVPFTAYFNDFVLTQGAINITGFPVETNAEMMYGSVAGWLNIPDYDGSDLYLPPILTKEGMIFDREQIGTIGFDISPVDLVILGANHNKMPCDGGAYTTSDYSPNGIPFSRLWSKLSFANPIQNGAGIFGTGQNYILADINQSGAQDDVFRIVYNTSGTGSLYPQDVNTGYTFQALVAYNGSITGTSPLNLKAFVSGTPGEVICRLNSGTFISSVSASGSGGGLSAGQLSATGDIYAFQNLTNNSQSVAFAVFVNNVASLIAGPGNQGRYLDFSSNSAQYRLWFYFNGEAVPSTGIGSRLTIQLVLDPSMTTTDVAKMISQSLNGLAMTSIDTLNGTIPPAGSYFLFYSNPSAIRTFAVYFTVNGVGSPPSYPGAELIQIVLNSSDPGYGTPAYVRDALRFLLNKFQFSAPLYDGMFFRAADPNATYDKDAVFRWADQASIGGNNPGTFEYQQLLSHYHLTQPTNNEMGPYGLTGTNGATFGQHQTTSLLSGGTETRPVNAYVYPFIRY